MVFSRFIAVVLALAIIGSVHAGAEQPPSPTPPPPPAPAPPSPTGPTDPTELGAFLDGIVEVEMAELHIPGVVLVAVKDGQVMLRKGYGFADAERKTPVEPDRTLFQIGSVSKVFNATAVMQLVEQGKLNLDADVNTYLTAFKVPDTYEQPITLANLLSHTAGFDDRTIGMMASSKDSRLPLGEYLALRLPRRVMPPGDVISYSNHGAALAGYIVEVVSGESFAHYVDEHIFQPLGMTRSSFDMPDAWLPDIAVGYYYDGELRRERIGHLQMGPAGSMVSTGDDMAQFMFAQLAGGAYGGAQILAPQTLEAMQRIWFTHDDRLKGGMALGIVRMVHHGQTVLGHSGGLPGFSSFLALLPACRFGFFIACNSDDTGMRDAILREVLDRYFPRTQDEEAPAPPADFSERAAFYEGYYRSNRYARYSIEKLTTLTSQVQLRNDGAGYLTVSGLGADPQRFVECGRDLFMNVERGTRMAYRADASVNVAQLVTSNSAYDKLPWYESAPVQQGVLAGLILIFLGTAIGWPVGAITRTWRRQSGTRPGVAARFARFAAWLVATANAGLILLLAYTLASIQLAEIIEGVPRRLVYLLYVPLVTAPAAAVMFILCCMAWRKKWWGVLGRVHYTVVTLACLGFVPFLWYWNLLGFHW